MHGYPRPQLQREQWVSLNGPWDFAIDPDPGWTSPTQVAWGRTIQVPYSPETPKSGIGDTGLYAGCWYRRRFDAPRLMHGEHLLLHFGAVDYRATVWINGLPAMRHEGGYTPFSVDLTHFIRDGEMQEVIVHAEDDPQDLAKPRGKQDWQKDPHSIWYPRTTGIWQTVWFEIVPATWLRRIRWTPSLERWEVGFEAWIGGQRRERLRLGVQLRCGDQLLADDTYEVVGGEVHRRIALSDPGIDDFRNELLWSPSKPTLIDVRLRLWADRGELLDEATSYTALRSIAIEGDRFVLNGRPYVLRLVLDQGYWPESGLTAPDDAALEKDVRLARAMGFNGVRKHQKIEDPRYLYWADTLGLLVWEEMPSAYRFTQDSVERVTREWLSAVDRDYSHPCIVAWVPFNESWGVPNLPTNPAERHYVQGLYHLTKTLDRMRPVIGNDGWESVATDIIGIHDYDADPARIARRYHADEILPRLFKRERPGGRRLVLEGDRHADLPIMITEFGGITFSPDEKGTWGYSRATSPQRLAELYHELLATIHNLGLISGFCYTQFADTYQEANGLLFANRTPKFPLDEMSAATQGLRVPAATPEPSPGAPGSQPVAIPSAEGPPSTDGATGA